MTPLVFSLPLSTWCPDKNLIICIESYTSLYKVLPIECKWAFGELWSSFWNKFDKILYYMTTDVRFFYQLTETQILTCFNMKLSITKKQHFRCHAFIMMQGNSYITISTSICAKYRILHHLTVQIILLRLHLQSSKLHIDWTLCICMLYTLPQYYMEN